MSLRFTKMHGLGNDFVVFDLTKQAFDADPGTIRAIADRRFGIGCDQVLLIERARSADTEFHYRIFNADGGEVEQCGNGARCFARFVYERGLTRNRSIRVGTAGGPIVLHIGDDDSVRVNMGVPVLEPAKIPFVAHAMADSYTLEVDDESLEIGAVSMGNPHAVIRVDAVAEAPVDTLGPSVQHHQRFPQQANVGFMALRDRGQIDLRVFERGSGETLACGTGACAAVVYGRLRGWLDPTVEVKLSGGTLVISCSGKDEAVWMQGPASFVFDGHIDTEALKSATP
jgi:diaminopimelate epimerase